MIYVANPASGYIEPAILVSLDGGHRLAYREANEVCEQPRQRRAVENLARLGQRQPFVRHLHDRAIVSRRSGPRDTEGQWRCAPEIHGVTAGVETKRDKGPVLPEGSRRLLLVSRRLVEYTLRSA